MSSVEANTTTGNTTQDPLIDPQQQQQADGNNKKMAYNSYQHNIPGVKQLDDEVINTGLQKHAYYGDATLEPNTGLTNRYDYALFGLSLHELLDKLRLSIIINSVFMSIVLFFDWWTRLLNPIKFTLSIILGVIVLIMLIVEVMSIFRSVGTNSASTQQQQQQDSNTNQEKFKKFLKVTEQIGLMVLYHPIGKTIYLLICGILSWLIGGIWEWILGCLFLANSTVMLYCWITYPEFRRTFDIKHDNIDDMTPNEARTAQWSYYYQAATNSVTGIKDKFGEQATSLLSNNTTKDQKTETV